MPHTKFSENRPAGSGAENFLMFLPYMGVAAILVMCPDIAVKLSFPLPMDAPHKMTL